MDLKDYIKFANENPICYIATEDGIQPRVRAFRMWYADESGFYFHTGSTKNIYKQLQSNRRVEICFCTPRFDKMMRVTGEAEFIDNPALKKRLVEERPFLKAVIKGLDDPLLTIFRLHKGEAHFWTMEDNLLESGIPRVQF